MAGQGRARVERRVRARTRTGVRTRARKRVWAGQKHYLSFNCRIMTTKKKCDNEIENVNVCISTPRIM